MLYLGAAPRKRLSAELHPPGGSRAPGPALAVGVRLLLAWGPTRAVGVRLLRTATPARATGGAWRSSRTSPGSAPEFANSGRPPAPRTRAPPPAPPARSHAPKPCAGPAGNPLCRDREARPQPAMPSCAGAAPPPAGGAAIFKGRPERRANELASVRGRRVAAGGPGCGCGGAPPPRSPQTQATRLAPLPLRLARGPQAPRRGRRRLGGGSGGAEVHGSGRPGDRAAAERAGLGAGGAPRPPP